MQNFGEKVGLKIEETRHFLKGCHFIKVHFNPLLRSLIIFKFRHVTNFYRLDWILIIFKYPALKIIIKYKISYNQLHD